MATPDQDVYALVNGFMLGTRQVKLTEYADLLPSAPRRGRNLPAALTDSIRFYPRLGGEKLAQVNIQIHGKWTADGAVASGNHAKAAHILVADMAAEGGLLGIGADLVDFELHVWDTTYIGEVQPLGLFEVKFPSPEIATGVLELSMAPTLITATP